MDLIPSSSIKPRTGCTSRKQSCCFYLKEPTTMDDRQIDILRRLVPHLDDIPMSSDYWIERAGRVIAVSTQDRDIYPVLDHTRGHGVFIYDLEGNEYLDVTAG